MKYKFKTSNKLVMDNSWYLTALKNLCLKKKFMLNVSVPDTSTPHFDSRTQNIGKIHHSEFFYEN